VHATASNENKGPYTGAQGKQIAATHAATSMLKALQRDWQALPVCRPQSARDT